MKRMTGTLIAFVVFQVITAASAALALEPFAFYDGFTAPLINPNKWFGYEDNKKQSLAEAVRVVESDRLLGGRLRLMTRGYGRTGAVATGESKGGNRLRFFNGDKVTAMRAKIWVKQYALRATSGNPKPALVRARLIGFFFNVGTPVAGSAAGDVLAQAYVRRESNSTLPANTLEVRASVVQCTDADCTVGTILGATDLGRVNVGQPVTLQLQWDKPNKRFIVRRDSNAAVSLSYTVSDALPPSLDNNKRLEVQYEAPDGVAAPRSMGYINAFFDNVSVNRSAR